ncbi:hypothetical protein [Nocardiopsis sp. FR26]|uniref:hypothetical protein n=1 Tax=Nocardiopsis sp. FR26 TaxID=2605987 RepID=UPI00135A8394|nr:hypothetical protein [Nocardiopsis sp. FR26]
MSETIRNEMHDKLETTLTIIAAAFARVNIRIGDPTRIDLDHDIHHWQQAVWESTKDLANLNTGHAWTSTIGLEDAASRWVHAATAYTAYRHLSAEFNEGLFWEHMAPCESALSLLVDGARWTVRG